MNEIYTVTDRITGQVMFSGECNDPHSLETTFMSVIVGVAYTEGYVEEGVNIIPTGRPSQNHTFNYITKQWEDPRTLDERKAQAWGRIKAAREQEEFGVFAWGGGTFDCDQISQQRIQGAAQLASLAMAAGQPFSIDWTMADNSTMTLGASDMIGVGMAMGAHINACHTKSRLLRNQINAAASAEEIEAITW